MMKTLWGNAIFTNCALTDDRDVWWEEMTSELPNHLIDWQGQDWTPAFSRKAAHLNARFTVSITQCPVLPPDWDNPEGVPIDIIVLGERRTTIPLTSEAYSFEHGIFFGTTQSSKTTVAAPGQVGKLRRNPFAMLPFYRYHTVDYFTHRIKMGARLSNKEPHIFCVNWFRKSPDGCWLWSGYGENSRALKWMCERVENRAGAIATPIGLLPRPEGLGLRGLDVPSESLRELLHVDELAWRAEVEDIERHLPIWELSSQETKKQLKELRERPGMY